MHFHPKQLQINAMKEQVGSGHLDRMSTVPNQCVRGSNQQPFSQESNTHNYLAPNAQSLYDALQSICIFNVKWDL